MRPRVPTRATLAVAVVSGIVTTIANATCPGVVKNTITSSSFETVRFLVPGTSSPAVVTFDVQSIDAGDLDVYASGTWTAITAPAIVEGSRIRLSASGSADVSYLVEECEEWLFTSDE